VFSGVPAFAGNEAILFDSAAAAANATSLPENVTFSRLEVRFPNGVPDAGKLSPDLVLLLYVGDLSAPRARVRLADLLRKGGTRPLNVKRTTGEPVRLVLHDPDGAWPQTTPRMEVILA
jgi:Ca-activated chloride channel family protein